MPVSTRAAEPDFKPIKQFAAKYDVSDETVRRLIASGDIEAVRIGQQIRVDLNQPLPPVTHVRSQKLRRRADAVDHLADYDG